jgi:hypothetical protein
MRTLQVGYAIGTSFTNIWDVSNCNLEEGKMEGLAKLTIFTSLLQLSPVCLIWMFPTGKQAVFDSLKDEVSLYVQKLVLTSPPHPLTNQFL